MPKPSGSKFGLGVPAAELRLEQILIIATIIAKGFTTNWLTASSKEGVVDSKGAFVPKMATYSLL